MWGVAVLIYLFRDETTDNVALTVDVTGQNIPPITPLTDWLFVEAIDTLRFPPPWDPPDFPMLAAPAAGGRFFSVRGGC